MSIDNIFYDGTLYYFDVTCNKCLSVGHVSVENKDSIYDILRSRGYESNGDRQVCPKCIKEEV